MLLVNLAVSLSFIQAADHQQHTKTATNTIMIAATEQRENEAKSLPD